jgi:curved DNA-binding protein CbpA
MSAMHVPRRFFAANF